MTDPGRREVAWWRVHWKAEPGKALCARILGVEKAPAFPGDWLVRERENVTCEECLEWMHA